MLTSQVHSPSSRTHNSNLFVNYRIELYCAQVQLVYKTNFKIVLKIDSFMNRAELEPSFFRIEHRAIIECINSFTAIMPATFILVVTSQSKVEAHHPCVLDFTITFGSISFGLWCVNVSHYTPTFNLFRVTDGRRDTHSSTSCISPSRQAHK